jgi:hypothetical protein
LDPWQQLVINGLFQRDANDDWVSKNGLLIVPRQNGKGAVIEAWELARLFLFGEQEVLHTAHHDRTVRDGFNKMVNRIQESPVLSDRLMADRSKGVRVANGQRSITFNTGQKLTYATRSSGAGRGQTLDAVVLDEVQHLDDEELESLSSTIATKRYGQIVMAGSAPIPGKSESLRRLVAAGRDGDRHLTYFEWSLDETVQHDLDDPANWAKANPGYGFRLFDGPFLSDRVLLTPDGFAREHLGIVEVEDPGVFPAGAWVDVADPQSEVSGQVSFAVDVNPDRSYGSISIAGLREDGLVHVELVDRRDHTEWIVERVAELDRKWTPVAVVVDEGGPAGSLIGDLERAGVTVTRLSMRQVAQATGQFFDAVVAKTVRHRAQPLMDAAAFGAAKRPLMDAWAWGRKNQTVDVSPLVAATLAHWGLIEHLDGGGLAPDDVYVGKF